MMKILIPILAALLFAAPLSAAEATKDQAGAAKADKPADIASTSAKDTNKTPADEKIRDFSCPYFTVKLPDNWQAILPPTEQQGMTNAIFAKSGQNPQVAIIVTPHGGADAKTIADMFAEQFKAPKPPVQKNGQYTFSFVQGDLTAQVWISREDEICMVTTIAGDKKAGLDFIKNSISSEKYSDLFPK